VLWVTKKSVVARATRFAFGVHVVTPCDDQSALRLGRPIVRLLDGSAGVKGAWSEIVPKVCCTSRNRDSRAHIYTQGHVFEEGEEVSRVYERLYDSPNPVMSQVKDRIYMYDQSHSTAGNCPQWVLGPFGQHLYLKVPDSDGFLTCFGIVGEILPGFQDVCTIEIDLSYMKSVLQRKKKPSRSCFQKSESHWVLNYRIAFTFGSTELKAFVIWDEHVRIITSASCHCWLLLNTILQGVSRRGPATIIPVNHAMEGAQ
jgi:hypothetical protein